MSLLNKIGNTIKNMIGTNSEKEKDDKRWTIDKSDIIFHKDSSRNLFRIIALKDFDDVKAGDKGGYIDEETCIGMDQEGTCWIYPGSFVAGDVRIKDNVKIINSNVYNLTYSSGGDDIFSTIYLFNNVKIENSTIRTLNKHHQLILRDTVTVHNSELTGHIDISGNIRIMANSVLFSSALDIKKGIRININKEGIILNSIITNNVFIDSDDCSIFNSFISGDVKVIAPCILNSSKLGGSIIVTRDTMMFDFDVPKEQLKDNLSVVSLVFIANPSDVVRVLLYEHCLFVNVAKPFPTIKEFTLEDIIAFLETSELFNNSDEMKSIFDAYFYTFQKFITICPQEISTENLKSNSTIDIELTEELCERIPGDKPEKGIHDDSFSKELDDMYNHPGKYRI